MDEFEAAAALVGLFALRCILPLAFTIGLGYMMNRVADRWQAEDRAQVAAATKVKPRRAPARPQPAITIPCWLFFNCSPARREKCPAYSNPTVACWAARSAASGRLPAKCATCPIHAQAYAHVVVS
jgi:hypothetical protein